MISYMWTLTLWILCNFSWFCCCPFKINLSEKSLRNTIRVSNCLNPVQDLRSVGPDLGHGPNRAYLYQVCLSRQNLLIWLSRDMRFQTMWYARPAKAQTSMRIRKVWSEPLLAAWIFYEYQTTDLTSFGVSMLNRRLHRLVWVYTSQNATLLEISCHGPIIRIKLKAINSLLLTEAKLKV